VDGARAACARRQDADFFAGARRTAVVLPPAAEPLPVLRLRAAGAGLAEALAVVRGLARERDAEALASPALVVDVVPE
jgi:hypothetical protein